jgi:hypothetical protein
VRNVTPASLLYRNIFAVLTWDSVIIYDTIHDQPLAVARGLHYANIVDASWTADGHTLMVCSTDGYISILRFSLGELGDVYHPPGSDPPCMTSSPPCPRGVQSQTRIPPCEPGSAIVQVPPRKKTRITPSRVIAAAAPAVMLKDEPTKESYHGSTTNHKRTASEAVMMAGAVHKLSLVESTDTNTALLDDDVTTPPPQVKKQKKRIQPIQLVPQQQLS